MIHRTGISSRYWKVWSFRSQKRKWTLHHCLHPQGRAVSYTQTPIFISQTKPKRGKRGKTEENGRCLHFAKIILGQSCSLSKDVVVAATLKFLPILQILLALTNRFCKYYWHYQTSHIYKNILVLSSQMPFCYFLFLEIYDLLRINASKYVFQNPLNSSHCSGKLGPCKMLCSKLGPCKIDRRQIGQNCWS